MNKLQLSPEGIRQARNESIYIAILIWGEDSRELRGMVTALTAGERNSLIGYLNSKGKQGYEIVSNTFCPIPDIPCPNEA